MANKTKAQNNLEASNDAGFDLAFIIYSSYTYIADQELLNSKKIPKTFL